MFALLQSQAKKPTTTSGDSMKFQYGNGDQPLDGYTIKRGVGVGGFGEVYFAESDSGKEVALKRIQKNLDVEMRGVRHCLNLRHPNLVGIYDIRFDKNEQGWIVMEFIEGESLRESLDRTPQGMSPEQAVPLFAQIVAGCTYLHDQGIVHRDLKPANIFIENSMAKIGDYGLSKYISASRRAGQTESVGTFHYMAPEIGKGEYGKEIDIYSLGIILYEMLTGNVPFDGESTQEIILKHLTADPDLSMLPPPFAQVVSKALAKNPTSRYRDGRELLADLGYAIDPSGLAIRGSGPQGSWQAKAHAIPVQPPSLPKVVYTKGQVPVAIPGQKPPLADRMQMFFNVGLKGHAEALKHEPVAKMYLDFLQGMGLWSRDRREKGWWYVPVAVAVAIFVLINSGWITPSLVMIGWGYLIYYVVWFLNIGYTKCGVHSLPAVPSRSPPSQGVPYVRPVAAAALNPAHQETVHFERGDRGVPEQPATVLSIPPGKPISSKEALRIWQQQERDVLSQEGWWTRMYSATRAMTFAAFITGINVFGGGFLMMSHGEITNNQWLGAIAWLGVMTTLTSWVIIMFSRRWESRQEDSIVFRFVLMAAGLLLGAASFQLSEYLMIPWAQITDIERAEVEIEVIEVFDGAINRGWKGFYDAEGMPVLAGHMAYFASLMWILRWWRQSDILRKKRFSIWPILFSVILAALVQGIFYFPGPWHVLLAAATSFVVQMASPWKEPATSRIQYVSQRPVPALERSLS
jgi:eukaryotic-like serine/threonine-protein kinase